MPPKKDKEAKVPQLKGDEAEAEILAYLKQQNRPYNSTDVSLNMKTVSKITATKALAALAEKSLIVAKPYGKQIIYATKQDVPTQVEGEDDLEEVKKDITAATTKITELKEGIKSLTSKRDKLATQPSTAELLPLTEKLLSETQIAQTRLQKLKEEPDCLISTSDLDTQDKAYDQAHKLWVGRKKAFKTLLDAMTESMDKAQREDLLDDLFDGVPDEGEEAKRIVEEEKIKLIRPVKKRKIG